MNGVYNWPRLFAALGADVALTILVAAVLDGSSRRLWTTGHQVQGIVSYVCAVVPYGNGGRLPPKFDYHDTVNGTQFEQRREWTASLRPNIGDPIDGTYAAENPPASSLRSTGPRKSAIFGFRPSPQLPSFRLSH